MSTKTDGNAEGKRLRESTGRSIVVNLTSQPAKPLPTSFTSSDGTLVRPDTGGNAATQGSSVSVDKKK